MKVKEIRILRKFSFGAASYENEDIEVTFDVSKETKSLEELTKEAFNQFHLIVRHSDLPNRIKTAYYHAQIKEFRAQENENKLRESINEEV